MKIKHMLYILSFLFLNSTLWADTDELIKRNVLIVPFVNANKNPDYDDMKNIVIDAIRANLINTDKFNLSDHHEVEKQLRNTGIDNDKIYDPAFAVKFAKNMNFDVVIIGKYIIIDEKIIIHIQVVDVFTEETGIIIYEQGNLGINLMQMIDNISKNLSVKMADKFPKVDRTYFNEMTRLLDDRGRIKFNYSAQTVSGITLCITGSILFSAGLPVFIYDLAGYSAFMQANWDKYCSTLPRSKALYDKYKDSYYAFIGMFISGLILSSAGLIMAVVSIPLIIYKKKEEKLSIIIGLFPRPGINFLINL